MRYNLGVGVWAVDGNEFPVFLMDLDWAAVQCVQYDIERHSISKYVLYGILRCPRITTVSFTYNPSIIRIDFEDEWVNIFNIQKAELENFVNEFVKFPGSHTTSGVNWKKEGF